MFSWLRRKIINFFDWVFSLGRPNSQGRPQSQSPYQNQSGSNSNSLSEPNALPSISNTIRIIGDRDCGKTTYLAALIRNPNPDFYNNPIENIVPKTGESEKLENQATIILEDGKKFNPSDILGADEDLSDRPNIAFSITLKDKRSRSIQLEIFCKDYSGEIFGDINVMEEQALSSYINDCADPDVQGLMILLDATKHRQDSVYEISMRTFIRRLLVSRVNGWKGKIAVALTKCENLQIYSKRRELKSSKALVEKYFPKTLQSMRNNLTPDIEVEYFSLSAFGMMGPEGVKQPNVEYVKDITDPTLQFARLKNKNVWRPFGLFAPLYWLCTGDRHPNLD